MPRDLRDLSHSLLLAANGLPAAAREGVEAAALLVTTEARKNIRDAVGSDMRMSRVGEDGAKVGARYDVRGTVNPMALVTAVGPLHLIERDTKPHTEMPHNIGRARGRSKAARRQAKQDLYSALFGSGGFAGSTPLRTPYGPRYRVDHPGTKGKHPFERAVNSTQALVPGIVSRKVDGYFRRAFLR